jgi:hypothetical protein
METAHPNLFFCAFTSPHPPTVDLTFVADVLRTEVAIPSARRLAQACGRQLVESVTIRRAHRATTILYGIHNLGWATQTVSGARRKVNVDGGSVGKLDTSGALIWELRKAATRVGRPLFFLFGPRFLSL